MVLIIDPQVSGVAGNMFIGAFIDLGANKDKIVEVIKTYGEYFGIIDVKIEKKLKAGIMTTYAQIKAEDNNKARHYHDIIENLDMITKKHYPDDEKIHKTIQLTKKIFKTIADAECKAHDMSIDKIHFHEVGNADAVCDVIGSAYAYYDLKLDDEKIYSLPVATGYGSVNTQHGILPVPAPAVANILAHTPVHTGEAECELATPTGSAILVNITDEYVESTPTMVDMKIGYGAGCKDLKILNALRLIHATSMTPKDTITVLETNVDTLTGEVLGSLFDIMLNEGARDISITPTIMKKNRPGHIIKIICKNKDAEHLCNVLIKHTGTLGVRIIPTLHRSAITRKNVESKITIEDKTYPVNFKIGYTDDKIIKCTPEYEDIKKISKITNLTIQQLTTLAIKQYEGEE